MRTAPTARMLDNRPQNQPLFLYPAKTNASVPRNAWQLTPPKNKTLQDNSGTESYRSNFQACIKLPSLAIAEPLRIKNSNHSWQTPPATGWAGFFCLLVMLQLFIFQGLAATPEYRIGETSRVDIITPVTLMVVDREATQTLRQREAQKTPAIFRYYPEAIDEAEANLRGTFAFTREDFLESLEISFQQRRLTSAACAKPSFAQFLAVFTKRNNIFPLSTNLAQAWATGGADEAFLSEWVARVRQAMHQYIRPDPLPPEARFGPALVRLLIVRSTNTPVTLDMAEQLSTRYYRTNFVSLAKARTNLQKSLPAEEQALGKFLAFFVKENCVFDPALTRQSRDRQSQSIWAADTYEPGQAILKSGEVVTAKAKAALDELTAKTALQAVKAQAVEEAFQTRLQGDQLHLQMQASTHKALEKSHFLLGGTLAALAMALFFLWRSRRSRPQNLLPARTGQRPPWLHTQGETALLSCPSCSETIIVDLPMEKRAAASAPAAVQPRLASLSWRDLRGRIPPWLQEFLRKAWGALLWQRSLLLDTQRQAEMEVAALEKRLAKMHAPIQDRINAYEKLIADLQNDLTAQRQQNAGLIQAQIDLMKQKVAREREKAPKRNAL